MIIIKSLISLIFFFLPFPEGKCCLSISEALPDSTFILFVVDMCIVTSGEKS